MKNKSNLAKFMALSQMFGGIGNIPKINAPTYRYRMFWNSTIRGTYRKPIGTKKISFTEELRNKKGYDNYLKEKKWH